jgi:uracil-DNA glycosylase
MVSFLSLLKDVRSCSICKAHLPLGPRPVLQVHPKAQILIAGQAPGRRVHESGVSFNDPSGDRLRQWLGILPDVFYDAEKIALMAMGFCYPGTGKSGDLPPRPECAPAWREQLLGHLSNVQMTLVLGQYAQAYHFGKSRLSLTERVLRWRDTWPHVVPLPHPSPRNNLWLKRNLWFEKELLPSLQEKVSQILNT